VTVSGENPVYYSSHKPSAMITLNKRFKYDKEIKKGVYRFKGSENNEIVYIWYRKNPNIETRVDYYYQIDSVLYNSSSAKLKAYKHGKIKINEKKFFYCDYIRQGKGSWIALDKWLVLPSSEMDWLNVEYQKYVQFAGFKDTSAKEYFESHPDAEKSFEKSFRDAIVSVGDYGMIPPTERWQLSMDAGKGIGQFIIIKNPDGAISTSGNWKYSQTSFSSSEGIGTVSGKAVSFTIKGIGKKASGATSPYCLMVKGNCCNGQGGGTYTIEFTTQGWPGASGKWTANRISGRGISAEE